MRIRHLLLLQAFVNVVFGEGPPDPPAKFQLHYVNHYRIILRWNCMRSNHNKHPQYIYTVLQDVASNAIVGVSFNNVSGACFDKRYVNDFWKNINPDTDYLATVNSTNDLGTSDIVMLRVRTAKPIRLYVPSGAIQINYPQVLIRLRIEHGNDVNTTMFHVLSICIDEFTGRQAVNYSRATNGDTIIVHIGDSIPEATEYVFSFLLLDIESLGGLGYFITQHFEMAQSALIGVRVNTKANSGAVIASSISVVSAALIASVLLSAFFI